MEINKEDKNAAIMNGALCGIITLLLGIISLYLMVSFNGSFTTLIIGVVMFALTIFIYIYFTKDLRKKIGGYWSFKQAFVYILFMFAISTLISYSGNLIYTHVIDKNINEKIKTKTIDNTRAMLEKQNMDEDKVDETIQKIETQFDEQLVINTKSVLLGFGKTLSMILVFSLVFALIFKKEKLRTIEYDQSSNL